MVRGAWQVCEITKSWTGAQIYGYKTASGTLSKFQLGVYDFMNLFG